MAGSGMKQESQDARRLHLGRKFSYERLTRYRARFIDPATGRFYPHLLRSRACPVCDGTDHVEVFVKDGGTTVKCLACTMVFLNPCFTEEALAHYYRDLDSGQAEIVAREGDFYREIYGLGLASIERHASPGTLLDIGCSSGAFLDLARERGWRTLGIEPGLHEAELARARGHEVTNARLDELDAGAQFDVVSLWDVFEHIPDGRRYWQAIDRHLSPRGVVLLQIPNSDALAARMLREHCHMHDGLEHVNLYNPSTIRRFAESVGYRVLELASVISEISVINNYLHYEDPYFGSSSFGPDLLGLIDEQAIHEKLLGYKLQVVFGRR